MVHKIYLQYVSMLLFCSNDLFLLKHVKKVNILYLNTKLSSNISITNNLWSVLGLMAGKDWRRQLDCAVVCSDSCSAIQHHNLQLPLNSWLNMTPKQPGKHWMSTKNSFKKIESFSINRKIRFTGFSIEEMGPIVINIYRMTLPLLQ